MAKIGILVPRDSMLREAEALLKDMDLEIVCCRTVATTDTVNEARAAMEMGAQILVARGYQAKLLRKYTDIPLVEIRFTGQEVGLLLQRARQVAGRQHPHVAVVAFENMLPDMTHMASLMDVRLTVSSIPDAEVVGAILEEYEADRPDVIIGGEVTCEAARARGYLTIFYQSTKESIAEALRAAGRMSYAIDMERQHAARFEAVLDTSFSAVVQVNAEQCIISLNHEAEQLMRRKEQDALGCPVSELLPMVDPAPLRRVLAGERESMTISVEIREESFMLLISPIEFDGRITGAILSFQQISSMSSLSRQAKREMLLSGHRTNLTFRDLETKNPRMKELLETAEIFALSDSPILFYESEGTEAGMIARAVHNHSNRRSGPFVSLDIRDLSLEEQNDALLSRDGEFRSSPSAGSSDTPLQQSSLPGTGSPGAIREEALPVTASGAMIRANHGTLFINRIERLSLHAQHRLLRTLLSWTYMHTDARPIDSLNVRIIACAKGSLLPAVEDGDFSEELYYHLSGLSLTIPPLESRPEDLREAARSCILRYASRYHRHVQLTEEGLQLFTRLRWPGGFAQVSAFCERVVLSARKRRIDERILQDTYNLLYPEVRKVQGEQRLVVYDAPQAQQIRDLLEKHGGDRTAVARELGISKTTLWRHMKKYNVSAKF